MQNEFLMMFKRRSQRERFYSSMNYDEYCDVYGPPSPLFKPQDDPIGQIPLLELQNPLPQPTCENEEEKQVQGRGKMATILQVNESENFTQHLQRSPLNEFLSTTAKSRETSAPRDQIQDPKRLRLRMRSQSDNSEYLIFNFLQRANEKQKMYEFGGRKKVKFD